MSSIGLNLAPRTFKVEHEKEPDFTYMLKSALKCLKLSWHMALFTPQIETKKIGVPRIAKASSLNLRAECNDGKAE
jgi:hypothetical protein